MNIGIIGSGAYAIALASLIEKKNLNIMMWTPIEEEYHELTKNHTNLKTINYELDHKIKFTNSLQQLSNESNVLILVVPAKFVKSTIEELKPYYKDQEILIATKGMVNNPIDFINNYIKKTLQTSKICCISGPSFASDVIEKFPIGLTLASINKTSLDYFKNLFSNISFLSLETTTDIIGVELCGILKNIMAIGSGILNGMNINSSSTVKFLIDVSKEIQNIIKELGGDEKTFYTYAGLGDYILTTNNNKSRNFMFGKLIGSNQDYNSYLKNNTVEGVENLNIIYSFLKNNKIESKIIDILYEIVYLSKENTMILKFLESKE